MPVHVPQTYKTPKRHLYTFITQITVFTRRDFATEVLRVTLAQTRR